jgi:GxGYxYP putative glycoside hydrolase C-terminal domain/GxGYxYP_N second domain/GxGYxYP third domain/GxGYxYP_N 1st domain
MRITRRNFLEAAGATVCAALTHPVATGQESTQYSPGNLYWPAGQTLPTFPQPYHLDVANIQQLSGDQQVMLTTLQGIVNRELPRLYWLLQGDNTDQAWLDTLKVPYTLSNSPLDLIEKYRREIHGAVVYDPNVPDTINIATSLAGLKNAVIATADLASQYELPILEDLRGRFTDKLAAYNWLIDNYWPALNHRLLTGIGPASPVLLTNVTWTTLFKVTQPVTDASNKAVYTADLSSLLGGEAVYVRYQDAYPADGWGPSVSQVTVIANGNTIASFQPGTSAEAPFLYEADSSSLASGWRFADGSSYFIYKFTPPAGTTTLTLQTEMWNEFYVTATNQIPIQYVPFTNFRDYIVATNSLVFWLDPLVPAEAALFAQILQKVAPDTPYLGWFVGGHEDPGVTLCSGNGVPVGAADFFNNATVLGGALAPIANYQPSTNTPQLENKVYVTLTMSEGDNLQYDQHRMRSIWDDPNRGQVPLNWSISPLLLDAAPAMLHYYQRTQTANDFFVAGPSGAGYTYPGDWPTTALPSFTSRTGRYMKRTGMDVIYALNRQSDTNIDLSTAVAQQYEEDVPLLGILYNWIAQSSLSTPAGLPVFTQVGISTVADGQSALASATQGWNGSSPLFVALGVLAWNMAPTDVNNLVASLGSQYEVVRADVFFKLVRKTLG